MTGRIESHPILRTERYALICSVKIQEDCGMDTTPQSSFYDMSEVVMSENR